MLRIDILTALLKLGQDTGWLTHIVRAAIIVLHVRPDSNWPSTGRVSEICHRYHYRLKHASRGSNDVFPMSDPLCGR